MNHGVEFTDGGIAGAVEDVNDGFVVGKDGFIVKRFVRGVFEDVKSLVIILHFDACFCLFKLLFRRQHGIA